MSTFQHLQLVYHQQYQRQTAGNQYLTLSSNLRLLQKGLQYEIR